jgi:hypothetical protein
MRWASTFCWAAMAILACGLGGCSGGGPDAATADANKKALDLEANRKVDSAEALKKKLTEISESGTGFSGSGMAGLRSSIEALRATNPAVVDPLMQDLNELQGAKTPDEVKQIATRMAARL